MFDLLKEEIKNKIQLKKYLNLNMRYLQNKVRNFNSKKIKKKIYVPNKRIYKKYFVTDSSHLIWEKMILAKISSLALADKIFDYHLFDSEEKDLKTTKIDLFGFYDVRSLEKPWNYGKNFKFQNM